MKIISFSQPTFIQTSTLRPDGTSTPPSILAANPGERYVFNDDAGQAIQLAEDSKIESITDFKPFYDSQVIRPTKFRDKRILLYRNRGIGDQLAASSLSAFLTEKLRAISFQLCDRHHEHFWYGNPHIRGIPVRFPLSIDSLIRWKGRPFYDYAFFLESVSEWNCESEQSNFYDVMFSQVGFDPNDVPDEYKHPVWGMLPEDVEIFDKWKSQWGVGDSYIAVQVRATNFGRTPPVSAWKVVLERLDDIGLPVVVLDEEPLSEELADLVRETKNCINLASSTTGLRLFGSVIINAKLVVCPDSSALHFAASRGVPCIGLWGPFSPESRAKYYTNHYPLYTPSLCQNAPCYNFMQHLPAHKCPEGQLQKYCAVFDGVTADKVDSMVSDVVKNHNIV